MINYLKNQVEFEIYAQSIGFNPKAMRTPAIVEERELNMVTMSVFDRLIKDRIIWVSGVVDDVMSDVVQAQLLYLDSVSQEEITMYINTPGGSVMAGLGIIDTMEFIGCDVRTVNIGMCASMGSVLLGAGTKGKRQILINSQVMTHQVSYGASGNVQDVRITQKEAEKTNYLLFKRLASYSGQTIEKMLKDSERDQWLNSDKAVSYGLVDEVIGISETSPSITEQLEGFNEHYAKILDKMKD